MLVKAENHNISVVPQADSKAQIAGEKDNASVDSLKQNIPEEADRPVAHSENHKLPTGRNRSRRNRLIAILENFCDQTSMHGLRQVTINTVIVARMVWFLAALGAQVGLLIHISKLVQLYFGHPIQQSTTLVRTSVQFPDITVCNLNPLSSSNYERVSQIENGTLSHYLARLDNMYANGIITSTELSDLNTPINIIRNAGMDESKMIGHQLNDLILRCTFLGRPCNITTQFTWIMNAVLYNCYTFDPGVDGKDFVATGPETGLSLIFYLEETNGSEIQAEYTEFLTAANSMGVKVMVDSPDIYPQPHIEGLAIVPGHSTDVGFKLAEIREISYPYSNCINNDTVQGFANFTYGPTHCLNTCLQNYIMQHCGCKNAYYPIPDEVQDGVYCGTLKHENDSEAIRTHHEETTCSTDVWIQFSGSQAIKDECGCFPPCVHYTYAYTVTESRWPAPKYYDSFLIKEIVSRDDKEELKAYQQFKSIMTTYQYNATEYNDHDFISDNFARLNVYLRDLEMIKVEQKAAYPLSNLFSDIGGSLGLWLGLSVLTLMELVQLLVRISLVLCSKQHEE